MRHFTDIIDGYMQYTAGHESTDRIRKWSFISAIAGALERRVWLDRAYYTLFPNLYVFIIGKSGLIKKSTSTAIAVNLLREMQGIKLMSERLTAASLIGQLADSGKKFEVDGKFINQSPLFAYASELAVFLSEVFGSITELLTTFYDCQPNDSSKAWIHHTKGSGETKIFGPCLNILGASTKSWLTKCIPKNEMMEGGFTSRIIFVVENRIPKTLVAWPQLSEHSVVLKEKLIEDLRCIYSLKGKFEVELEAKQFFTEWYEHHMREILPQNLDPRMVGYMSRKGDSILKLAMIKAAAEGDALVMTKAHMEWGRNELDELEQDWRGAFEGLGVKDSLSWEIRNFIKIRGSVTKKEITDVFGTQFPMTEVTKELAELVAMREINEMPGMSPGDPGKYTAGLITAD